jgi:hypothetical protein
MIKMFVVEEAPGGVITKPVLPRQPALTGLQSLFYNNLRNSLPQYNDRCDQNCDHIWRQVTAARKDAMDLKCHERFP